MLYRLSYALPEGNKSSLEVRRNIRATFRMVNTIKSSFFNINSKKRHQSADFHDKLGAPPIFHRQKCIYQQNFRARPSETTKNRVGIDELAKNFEL
ncbi:hypothetical protein DEA98_22195 [Brucella pseudogrignonensis]|nr:hypothetical protein [Brucella pseudogrignonensis]